MMSETRLVVENLRKEFGSTVAVDDVSFSVAAGELLCLLGPSGCGKSTTLRMIAGLETPTDGEVYLEDQQVTDLPAYKRDSAMVFQNWALFPYKSVLENVAFGLKMDGVGKTQRRERAKEMLEIIQMEKYADNKTSELSGGQKQRVALARALAKDPDALLLDEPLSNLDKRLSEDMQLQLKQIHEQFQKATLHVTHDQNEAFTLADRIGIMRDGRLIQIGDPQEVYNNPKNRFIEEFLGESNFVEGTVDQENGVTTVNTAKGLTLELPPIETLETINNDDSISVSIRPEVISIRKASSADGGAHSENETVITENDRQTLEGTVENLLYRGSTVRYIVNVADETLFVEENVGADINLEEGDPVQLQWKPTDLICFDNTGARIKDEY